MCRLIDLLTFCFVSVPMCCWLLGIGPWGLNGVNTHSAAELQLTQFLGAYLFVVYVFRELCPFCPPYLICWSINVPLAVFFSFPWGQASFLPCVVSVIVRSFLFILESLGKSW